MKKEKIIDRIRKLLALSGSDNEHEASLAAATAQRLLSAHNMSMDEVILEGEGSRAKLVFVPLPSRFSPWRVHLFACVAEAFDCRGLHYANRKKGYFLGVGADPKVAAFTYDYLSHALKTLSAAFLKNVPANIEGRERLKTSYLMGAIFRINKRLQEQKQQTPVTSGTLVPVKQSAIEQEMNRLGINKTRRIRRKSFSTTEQIAYAMGYADGEKILLQQGEGNPQKRIPV